jgi:hypothetical protein
MPTSLQLENRQIYEKIERLFFLIPETKQLGMMRGRLIYFTLEHPSGRMQILENYPFGGCAFLWDF